ncbi:MAG: 1-(5-phosphoribosyl)-5-[(5-phosphoribosylamino)methylideneamino]imidazole-4-carboxamide isomerase [Dehalococcoidales bacterium]|jgi:phosphoribosylformimino-5-aminoimidazole carboxamide ribotide isomerase|nr:1-(5-phosphoribosyl)-5-[(5-phosphoribosylamino)methylideneamino]imidazole-4-carboxamide isomerase [Dehalococcoidales bacterium]
MEIIPAVDIRGGLCVRLYQGDYANETVFDEDPVQVALRWQSLGATRLHIVDLDGAAEGKPGNMDIIRDIAVAMMVPTQLGGGIRSMNTVRELLGAGIERVILGTAAVEDTSFVKEVCRTYAGSVIVSIDTRDGLVSTRGWTQDTKITGVEFALSMAKLGVKRFIYTDIVRDGTLTEPNFSGISELIEKTGLPVIAAGGVSTIQHLIMLKKLGAEGAIIGKALYTGDIDLKKALREVERA